MRFSRCLIHRLTCLMDNGQVARNRDVSVFERDGMDLFRQLLWKHCLKATNIKIEQDPSKLKWLWCRSRLFGQIYNHKRGCPLDIDCICMMQSIKKAIRKKHRDFKKISPKLHVEYFHTMRCKCSIVVKNK